MKALREAAAGLVQVVREAATADRVHAATLMTLLLVLLHAGGAWYFGAPLTILAGFGLLVPTARASAGFWLALTCILAFGNFYNWFAIDNHKYLMTWWCLAIYCSLLSPDPDGMVAFQGRTLLALCFLFAVGWKLMAPDYLNGSFFRKVLLTDERFASAAVRGAGVERRALSENRRAFSDLTNSLKDMREVTYQSGPRLKTVAAVATWWTIGIEGVLGLLFLFPPTWTRVERARHVLLLLFLFTTYAVAPVVPYGWTLLNMGMAACPAAWTRMRVGYLAAFVALQVYLTPLRPS